MNLVRKSFVFLFIVLLVITDISKGIHFAFFHHNHIIHSSKANHFQFEKNEPVCFFEQMILPPFVYDEIGLPEKPNRKPKQCFSGVIYNKPAIKVIYTFQLRAPPLLQFSRF